MFLKNNGILLLFSGPLVGEGREGTSAVIMLCGFFLTKGTFSPEGHSIMHGYRTRDYNLIVRTLWNIMLPSIAVDTLRIWSLINR